MPTRHTGFAPVVGESPRALVLGTFPGLASREREEYYAFPQNQFWRILYSLSGTTPKSPSYEDKLALLRRHGIALWDIIASCETDGSADTEIKNQQLIDLPGFLARHPTIRLVCFNGGNAARFAKQLGVLAVPATTLPSTSPANARYSYEHKLQAWRAALQGAGLFCEEV